MNLNPLQNKCLSRFALVKMLHQSHEQEILFHFQGESYYDYCSDGRFEGSGAWTAAISISWLSVSGASCSAPGSSPMGLGLSVDPTCSVFSVMMTIGRGLIS
jgi:hypothetical protein